MDRIILGLAAAAALALAAQASAADLPLPRDGWASGQVEASERAPAFCCWDSWDASVGSTSACDLDEGRRGFGTRDHEKTDAIRLYARFTNGNLDRLHTLAAACPVKTGTPVQRLEGIRTDDSVRWLTSLANRDETRMATS